jgi:hypothetical protein
MKHMHDNGKSPGQSPELPYLMDPKRPMSFLRPCYNGRLLVNISPSITRHYQFPEQPNSSTKQDSTQQCHGGKSDGEF